jgi:hypothetical protein
VKTQLRGEILRLSNVRDTQDLLRSELKYGEVFGRRDLSESTVYIPSASLCCYNRQRVVTPSDHRGAGCRVLDEKLAATKTARNE